MSYSLTYSMIIGSSLSVCFTANAALERYDELLLAGATDITVAHRGVAITLIELQHLALPVSLGRPPRQH